MEAKRDKLPNGSSRNTGLSFRRKQSAANHPKGQFLTLPAVSAPYPKGHFEGSLGFFQQARRARDHGAVLVQKGGKAGGTD